MTAVDLDSRCKLSNTAVKCNAITSKLCVQIQIPKLILIVTQTSKPKMSIEMYLDVSYLVRHSFRDMGSVDIQNWLVVAYIATRFTASRTQNHHDRDHVHLI